MYLLTVELVVVSVVLFVREINIVYRVSIVACWINLTESDGRGLDS